MTGLTALVRVPDASPGPVLRALDAGAAGVVLPRVHSADEVRAAVRASRYHPDGERGLNAGRPAGFGKLDLPAYLQEANREVIVVVMIEDQQGLGELETILSVPGVDMVLEGSADLSQSLGVPWQTRHPVVKEALCQMEQVTRRRGIPFCAIPRVPEDLPFWWERGVRTFVLGDERGIAYRALGANLRRYTEQLEQPIARE